ncbi:MAG: hypothetical protein ACI4U2_03370, partial [Christensenellaceae bacterium]
MEFDSMTDAGLIQMFAIAPFKNTQRREARREEIPVGIFNTKPRKREVLLNRQPVDTVTIAECYITLSDECKDAF